MMVAFSSRRMYRMTRIRDIHSIRKSTSSSNSASNSTFSVLGSTSRLSQRVSVFGPLAHRNGMSRSVRSATSRTMSNVTSGCRSSVSYNANCSAGSVASTIRLIGGVSIQGKLRG
jgi:hypothetical protein